MSALPIRPRLADHARVRRHHIDGDEVVVIHDARSGDLVRMGPREWDLVAGADGTRDFDALVLAAAKRGAYRRASEVRAVLDHLHALGLLADGLGYPPPVDAVDPARPLKVLPDYALTCDGSGGCCAMYGSVLFTTQEAARARAFRPAVLGGGDREDRAFMPDHGSGPDPLLAVALVGGRCAYLEGDGRCGIHAAGGLAAKPRGCRVFPATFVDDGVHVRISTSVECACVLASVGRAGGDPLVDPAARTRADLGPDARVAMLPDAIAISAASPAPRGTFVAWADAVLAALPEVDGGADAIAVLWSLAGAVRAYALDAEAARAAIAAPVAPDEGALRPWIEALCVRTAARVESADAWRAKGDRARLAGHWIDAAARRLRDRDARRALIADASPFGRDERFYLRALIHGHQLVGDAPIEVALRDRATRILLSRALPGALPEGEAARSHPLALVEAMMRGQGVGAYALSVSG